MAAQLAAFNGYMVAWRAYDITQHSFDGKNASQSIFRCFLAAIVDLGNPGGSIIQIPGRNLRVHTAE